jgi:uncharacterized repeat protein (TIGR04076 family)
MNKGGFTMGKQVKNNPCKVILRIISVRGTCIAGHEVGQEFDLSDGLILGYTGGEKTLCPSAFGAAFPGYRVLRHGGIHPWETDEDILTIPCPDPFNPVIMELRRVDEPPTKFPRKGQENL